MVSQVLVSQQSPPLSYGYRWLSWWHARWSSCTKKWREKKHYFKNWTLSVALCIVVALVACRLKKPRKPVKIEFIELPSSDVQEPTTTSDEQEGREDDGRIEQEDKGEHGKIDESGDAKKELPKGRRPLITNNDLRKLILLLSDSPGILGPWKQEFQRELPGFTYSMKSRTSQDANLPQFLSTTIYKNCTSTKQLRDFLMDTKFRMTWDDTYKSYEQIEIDEATGIEIGHVVREYAKLYTREYIIAFKVWEGQDETFFCLSKACRDPRLKDDELAKMGKYVHKYISGWRIQRVAPDRCELKVWHQEEVGYWARRLPLESQVVEYAVKFEANLRRYIAEGRQIEGPSAVHYITKIASK